MPRRLASTTARGYGHEHQQARKWWIARKASMHCTRCGRPLADVADRFIELDHDDHDRSVYRGLSCKRCNRSAGGRKGAQSRRTPSLGSPSRGW